MEAKPRWKKHPWNPKAGKRPPKPKLQTVTLAGVGRKK